VRAREPKLVGDVEMWRCPSCSEWKAATDYYRCKRSPSGLKSQCKRCHMDCAMATRNRELALKHKRESMRRRRRAEPEKYREREREQSRKRPKDHRVKARHAVHSALRHGSLVRPAGCERCGAVGRVTAHHHNYQQPLDVEWLCYGCHGREHRHAS
jgi:hypothetical protein